MTAVRLGSHEACIEGDGGGGGAATRSQVERCGKSAGAHLVVGVTAVAIGINIRERLSCHASMRQFPVHGAAVSAVAVQAEILPAVNLVPPALRADRVFQLVAAAARGRGRLPALRPGRQRESCQQHQRTCGCEKYRRKKAPASHVTPRVRCRPGSLRQNAGHVGDLQHRRGKAP